jgi:MarR family 2-MHQ and catechol resistance regulon transcriptional repressor
MGADFMTLYRLLTEVFVLLDDADRRFLRQHHLSIRQFNVLYHLDQEQGLNINELSHYLLCDKSNTTRLIERMKQDDLVTRDPDPNDRRYVSVHLTEKGAQLGQEAITAHRVNINEQFSVLSPEEQSTLVTLLTCLRDGLHTRLNQPEV